MHEDADISQPNRLYRCARVVSNLVKNISTKRLYRNVYIVQNEFANNHAILSQKTGQRRIAL